MFEQPEMAVLAGQMKASLRGKTIRRGSLGNSPHKFVWYNRTHEEFTALTAGKTIGEAHHRGRWLFVPVEPGYVLLLGECGGKALYHEAGAALPKKYHLYLGFEDDSFFTLTTQMWGAMELYEAGEEQNREYVKDMRPTPLSPGFTYEYFCALIDELTAQKKWSAKGLLTQEQVVPGLGNAIAQDILFEARLHPKHDLNELDEAQKTGMYRAIQDTVRAVIAQGGRYDETDLYGRSGGYKRVMDKHAAGAPCPRCGEPVEKMQYLGGACYFCPGCQD